MCGTCGCGQGEKRVEDPRVHQAHDHPHGVVGLHAGSMEGDHDHLHKNAAGQIHSHPDGPAGAYEHADHGHSHEHGRAHWHEHSHTHPDSTTHSHSHSHEHVHEHASSHQHTPGDDAAAGKARLLSVERDILARNDAIAAENRRALQAAKTLAFNLVSSPGSGKTALLVETLKQIGDKYPLAVIEGDQETTADADRIRVTGVPAIQINTGKGCHLDADLVRTAMARLGTPANGILFIENVGNLVCPAGFDLGEAHKVVIVSVTEGEDKPLKYSGMFAASALMIVTKTDLLPHLDFDVDRLIENARRINPAIGVLKLSARSGEGMERWIHWLETARALRLATD
ncbi:MAG: hydrogenase nickel incorporation protein HypB [Gammaproteobacteria bacterium]|nr:hydrogenase nickel incorporation protein HypB [Gammaproteobacteria bacterium]